MTKGKEKGRSNAPPPAETRFCPHPPFFKIRNAFSQISDCNCLTVNVLYLFPYMEIMHAHIRARVCKRN